MDDEAKGAEPAQGGQTAAKPPARDPFELPASEEEQEEEVEVVPTKEDKEVLEYARRTGMVATSLSKACASYDNVVSTSSSRHFA